jgi:hypothetical protein
VTDGIRFSKGSHFKKYFEYPFGFFYLEAFQNKSPDGEPHAKVDVEVIRPEAIG